MEIALSLGNSSDGATGATSGGGDRSDDGDGSGGGDRSDDGDGSAAATGVAAVTAMTAAMAEMVRYGTIQ